MEPGEGQKGAGTTGAPERKQGLQDMRNGQDGWGDGSRGERWPAPRSARWGGPRGRGSERRREDAAAKEERDGPQLRLDAVEGPPRP